MQFLDALGDTEGRHRWIGHAYCLMANNFRLPIEAPVGGLSQEMQMWVNV